MPDTVATLSTTLQTQLSGAGPQIATMTALYQALVAGTVPMLSTRTSRRVGLLNTAAGGTFCSLPNGTGAGDVAQGFSEVSEVSRFYGNLQAFVSNIAKINPTDQTGNVQTAVVANVAQSNLITWANALVAFAATYEAFEVETLPS
jgi:hypothetical protein